MILSSSKLKTKLSVGARGVGVSVCVCVGGGDVSSACAELNATSGTCERQHKHSAVSRDTPSIYDGRAKSKSVAVSRTGTLTPLFGN